MTRVVGIVGSELAKFTPQIEDEARELIRTILQVEGAEVVCSGGCHLGGVDVFAVQEAGRLGLESIVYPPAHQSWERGYRPRNIQIATTSEVVYCITVRRLPMGYKGMRFGECYHCGTGEHVKSGGCWTVKYARGLGKRGEVLVVGR